MQGGGTNGEMCDFFLIIVHLFMHAGITVIIGLVTCKNLRHGLQIIKIRGTPKPKPHV